MPFLGRGAIPWHHRTPLFVLVARCRIPTAFCNNDVARLGSIIEMQLNAPSVEMPQDFLNASLDRSVDRAIAGDEVLDNGAQRCGRELCGGAHGGGGGGMRMESLHFPGANRKCVMRNPIEMRRETPVLKLKPPGVCSVPLLAPSAGWSAPRGSAKKVTQ